METEYHRTVHPLTLSRIKPHLTNFSPDEGAGAGGGVGDGEQGVQGQGSQGAGAGGEQAPPELTPEQQKQIAEYEKKIKVGFLKELKDKGWLKEDPKANEKTSESKPTKPTKPIEDPDYQNYKRDVRALVSQADDIEDPQERQIYVNYLLDRYRGTGFVSAAEAKIGKAVEDAIGELYETQNAKDKAKFYKDHPELVGLEDAVDRIVNHKGTINDVVAIKKAASKHSTEQVTRQQKEIDVRAALEREGFMESGGKRGASPTPSLSTIEQVQAVHDDIRKAVASGKMDEVKSLMTKRNRLYKTE